MLEIMTYLANRKSDERGAVAIEYGLLALLIAVALVAAMTGLRGAIESAYAAAEGALTN